MPRGLFESRSFNLNMIFNSNDILKKSLYPIVLGGKNPAEQNDKVLIF